MKNDYKPCEIVLPNIFQSNDIQLIKKDINLREKEYSIKLLFTKENKYEADLLIKTKYKKQSKSIEHKLNLLKQNINNLFICQKEKLDFKKVEKNKCKYNYTKSNVTELGEGLTRENTKVQTDLVKKIKRPVSLSVDFKFFYKNKSIDQLFNKKITYNKLFK